MHLKKIIILLFLVSLTAFSCARQEADIILRNGDVYTVDEDQPWARVIVISGNKIAAVLNDEAKLDKYLGPSTRVIDLEGKLAVPGFFDAHQSSCSLAFHKKRLNFSSMFARHNI